MRAGTLIMAVVALSCTGRNDAQIGDHAAPNDASVRAQKDAAPPRDADAPPHDAAPPPPSKVDAGAPPDSGSSADSSASSGACTFGTPHDGDGSFTWYYFGQGTGQENGYYVTACGYLGTEPHNAGQNSADVVLDVASAGRASNGYFVAIPSASSSDFDTVNECGACVELTYGSSRIIATIVDACPKDSNVPCRDPGHLDVSTEAFNALGYSVGNPSNTTWRRVACPVSGNIRARLKSGNTDQVYFTNTVYPIVAVAQGGQPARHSSYGAWQLANGANAGGATVTLTDVEGHSLTAVVPGGGGDLGAQFPAPASCP
jgi:hypothetical protein